MKTEARRNNWAIFMAGTLAIGVFWLVGWLVGRSPATESDERITLRFAHDHLYQPVVLAYQHVIEEYEKLHPNIHVVQVGVPHRVWRMWLKTQLVGGKAGDILATTGSTTLSDEDMARFILPLTDWVMKPNPYNRGTPLEGVAWKDTFVDFMAEEFNRSLLDYYGVPGGIGVIRVYYNRKIFTEALGTDRPPADFDEFLSFCERIQARQAPSGAKVFPLAASDAQGYVFFRSVFRQQTQKYVYGEDFRLPANSVVNPALDFVRGRWRLDEQPLLDGWELYGRIARFFPPGYWQMRREDATFYFQQGRAAMIFTGNWDASELLREMNFPVGTFAFPYPTSRSAAFARNVLGQVSESGSESITATLLGINNASPHQAEAVDFLQFLTSQPATRIRMRDSYDMPAVRGVEPRRELAAFKPVLRGWPKGFSPDFRDSHADLTFDLVRQNLYRFSDPRADVKESIAAFAGTYRDALVRDLAKQVRTIFESLRLRDTTAMAWLALQNEPAMQAEAGRKLSYVWEGDSLLEARNYQMEYVLKRQTRRQP